MSDEIKELVKIVRDQSNDIAVIKNQVGATHEWVKSHETRILSLKEDLDRAKGGWFAMIGFTGMAGAIGALVARFFK